ncbi:MAG: GNAT family N-acetyltransferase [Candidatus Thorarchaeota archaeon]
MQIIELKFDDFHKIRSFFTNSKHLNFTVDAVIAGNSPMRVWVDSEDTPKSAFLWDQAHCYYFGGAARNHAFCEAVENILKGTLIPTMIDKNCEIFKIEYSSPEWEPILEKILRNTPPFKVLRKFFTLDTPLVPQWRDLLPSGFQIRRIDRKLFESNIDNLQAIIDEINECWYSVDDFLANGFGFCLVHTPEIKIEEVQGWCTGEYFSDGKCGIGIETFYKYRKRGFATAMASAFVEHCLSVHIQPHWDASANNEASIGVAKKVGFKEIQEYSTFLGAFTNVETFKGNHYYQEKDFTRAAKWYEKAAELNQRIFYNCYNAACSRALIGDYDHALNNLNKALDNWQKPLKRFINHIKTDADLANLHSIEGWKAILQRLNAIENEITSFIEV